MPRVVQTEGFHNHGKAKKRKANLCYKGAKFIVVEGSRWIEKRPNDGTRLFALPRF